MYEYMCPSVRLNTVGYESRAWTGSGWGSEEESAKARTAKSETGSRCRHETIASTTTHIGSTPVHGTVDAAAFFWEFTTAEFELVDAAEDDVEVDEAVRSMVVEPALMKLSEVTVELSLTAFW